MVPQTNEGSDEEGDNPGQGGVEGPPEVAAANVLPALVLQTDDVAEAGYTTEKLEQRPSSTTKTERTRLPRASYTVSRLSRASSMEPRPSVVHIISSEVATFYDVFGMLGVPMIAMFVVSAAWTFMMAAIQVHADSIANAIMNTTQFDKGGFWLLPKPDSGVIISAVVLLSLFGIGYTALAVTMIFFYRAGAPKEANLMVEAYSAAAKASEDPASQVTTQPGGSKSNFAQRVVAWVRALPRDVREHYFTAALDLPKLVFQTLTLSTYLRKGFPTPIIYYYSVLLLCNWLVASYRSQHYVVDPNLIIARLYYTFDLFFAVFAPLVILIYYVNTFKFDRAEFMTRQETLTAGTFDSVARIFGEPSQISSFCSAFHYLQFASGSTLFYKCALNLLSLYKWRKIILTLIHNHHERQLEKKRRALVDPNARDKSRTASIKAIITKKFSTTISKPRIGKQFFPKLILSMGFLAAGVYSFVYSIGSVQSTIELCSKYDKCVLTSYQWNFGEKHCTCLVFADRETSPRTYAAWTNPNDTTANLAELAIAGELRIIQIINRALPELPEELKNCHNLEQLILAYTKTEAIPEWVVEFSRLEYFHIEGDFTSRRLKTIADGVFDNMEHLAFLHLGTIPDLISVPSFSSLKKVRYLTLAVLDTLQEIPSFEGLSSVSDLNIINLPSVAALPSLEHLTSLKNLVIRARSAICCNGFISGTCNMTESQCSPITGEAHPLSCTDQRISEEDKAIIDSMEGTICPPSIPIARELTAPTLHSTDELCSGVKYRECSLAGLQGMCFNTRMMVINCETTSNYIKMRKLQIQRGVGDVCDPAEEAWLGCAS
ncbi:hypothetical protein PHYPSEUDO_004633 [Phytophthora pseudosyringae]|uniref:WLGC domain-containing protein n=1 Tax=Phytophthora pseudosyringae TaxID=221518 RepID=A0A8T1VRJ8_9STRA|nr:hypothetical protein PHYPSEUDO_004633 [Phytophthora pseudosyringae]